MAFGFGRLALAPAAFWSLTPRELAAAVDALAGERAEPPDRAAFARLMSLFPDREF
jgi:uncharacterized phage protein (TIGR02216 family)